MNLRLSLLIALVPFLALATADEKKGGLPTPDPKAKARLSVAWNPPKEWKSLATREGEFAAYRLARKVKTKVKSKAKPTLEHGPRLVIHYLGKATPRRALKQRQAAWARRFLSPERRRLGPEAAKTRTPKKVAKGLVIHVVRVRGDYAAVLAPGQEPGAPQRSWLGVYGHVVAADGVWVVVLLGSAKEIEPWIPELDALLAGAKAASVLFRPDPRESAGKRPASRPAPRRSKDGEPADDR
ncbi:MAG: hypothetical protein JKY65_04010 [Planctomycetes bacterium]|nr:hypothetical protein [Planctomycetota bacterium]